MNLSRAVSVIVPTLNEAENIPPLLKRIDETFAKTNTLYEVLIVDDNSTDRTVDVTESLSATYPLRVIIKDDNPGKAHSLLLGFKYARYPLVAMIDADLQYPPEALGPMRRLLLDNQADIVVTDRRQNQTSPLRRLSSSIFNLCFARLLFGIGFDTQSGLKLFRKSILNDFEMTPSPWSFDLEFLVRTLENKRRIISYPIHFAERTAGVTKVKFLQVAYELTKASLGLRWRTSMRRIRAGNRANERFARRALDLPLLVVALLTIFSLLQPSILAAPSFHHTKRSPVSDLSRSPHSSQVKASPIKPEANQPDRDDKKPASVAAPTQIGPAPLAPASTVAADQPATPPNPVSVTPLKTVAASTQPSAPTPTLTSNTRNFKPATANSNASPYHTAAYAPSAGAKNALTTAALISVAMGSTFILSQAMLKSWRSRVRRPRSIPINVISQ